MKKFIYLCGMMLLCMNVMAQIDLNDKNWDTVFIEDFSGNRYWDRHWDDLTGVSGYKPLWRCFKHFKLNTDCDTNIVLRTVSDFQCFHFSVKRSITMGGQSGNTLSIPTNTSLTMRAVDFFVIDGPIEVPQGTETTLIIQECPECSQEGVHSQNYCPL